MPPPAGDSPITEEIETRKSEGNLYICEMQEVVAKWGVRASTRMCKQAHSTEPLGC